MPVGSPSFHANAIRVRKVFFFSVVSTCVPGVLSLPYFEDAFSGGRFLRSESYFLLRNLLSGKH
jgi:hypothetical protein